MAAKNVKLTCEECGKEFFGHPFRRFCGGSHAAINRERIRHENGTFVHKFAREDFIRGVDLFNQGATWGEAASVCGINKLYLSKKARELGLPLRPSYRGSRNELSLTLPESEIDLAYLAGIVDGEGCITIWMGARLQVFVTVTNTSEALMDWLGSLGGKVRFKPNRPYRGKTIGKLPCYEWSLQGRVDTLALLKAIVPYMKIKPEKAKAGIKILEAQISKNVLSPEFAESVGLDA